VVLCLHKAHFQEKLTDHFIEKFAFIRVHSRFSLFP
jgi:hypothetical protein